MCEKYNEILYGVGFGIDYFRKISPRFRFRGIKNYEYRERSGKYGELPKTGKLNYTYLQVFRIYCHNLSD